jgi:hypothetical protein
MINIYALHVRKILPLSISLEMRFKDKIKSKYNGIFTALKVCGNGEELIFSKSYCRAHESILSRTG